MTSKSTRSWPNLFFQGSFGKIKFRHIANVSPHTGVPPGILNTGIREPPFPRVEDLHRPFPAGLLSLLHSTSCHRTPTLRFCSLLAHQTQRQPRIHPIDRNSTELPPLSHRASKPRTEGTNSIRASSANYFDAGYSAMLRNARASRFHYLTTSNVAMRQNTPTFVPVHTITLTLAVLCPMHRTSQYGCSLSFCPIFDCHLAHFCALRSPPSNVLSFVDLEPATYDPCSRTIHLA